MVRDFKVVISFGKVDRRVVRFSDSLSPDGSPREGSGIDSDIGTSFVHEDQQDGETFLPFDRFEEEDQGHGTVTVFRHPSRVLYHDRLRELSSLYRWAYGAVTVVSKCPFHRRQIGVNIYINVRMYESHIIPSDYFTTKYSSKTSFQSTISISGS